jgi:hypothetical protein
MYKTFRKKKFIFHASIMEEIINNFLLDFLSATVYIPNQCRSTMGAERQTECFPPSPAVCEQGTTT